MSYYLKDLLFDYNFLQNLYCLAQPVDTIFPENTAWIKGKVGYEYNMQIPKHYLNMDSTDYGEKQVILGFKATMNSHVGKKVFIQIHANNIKKSKYLINCLHISRLGLKSTENDKPKTVFSTGCQSNSECSCRKKHSIGT